MSEDLTRVPLHQVVLPVIRPESPISGKAYRQIGVRLWGEGAYERETMDGSQTKYATLSRVEANDIIVNKIWARNGSVAVVPISLDGCFCSGEFPTFAPITEKLHPRWFHWLTKTRGFWEQCDEKSRGTSGKNRIKPEQFLQVQIPLPPLAEQRRIIARIEELTANIDEAKGLRQQALEASNRLMALGEASIWSAQSISDAPQLDEVTTYLARGRQSEQGTSNHYLIKTQHVQMGAYIKTQMTLAPHIASKVAPDAVVQDKDVLIACSAAGCLGRVAFYTDTERTASTDTHIAIARADTTKLTPEYLYAYLKSATGQVQIRSREKGDWTREKIGFRLTELNLADLKKVPVPVPPIEEQAHIVAYLDGLQAKVDVLKALQMETTAELAALLPSVLDRAFSGRL